MVQDKGGGKELGHTISPKHMQLARTRKYLNFVWYIREPTALNACMEAHKRWFLRVFLPPLLLVWELWVRRVNQRSFVVGDRGRKFNNFGQQKGG